MRSRMSPPCLAISPRSHRYWSQRGSGGGHSVEKDRPLVRTQMTRLSRRATRSLAASWRVSPSPEVKPTSDRRQRPPTVEIQRRRPWLEHAVRIAPWSAATNSSRGGQGMVKRAAYMVMAVVLGQSRRTSAPGRTRRTSQWRCSRCHKVWLSPHLWRLMLLLVSAAGLRGGGVRQGHEAGSEAHLPAPSPGSRPPWQSTPRTWQPAAVLRCHAAPPTKGSSR